MPGEMPCFFQKKICREKCSEHRMRRRRRCVLIYSLSFCQRRERVPRFARTRQMCWPDNAPMIDGLWKLLEKPTLACQYMRDSDKIYVQHNLSSIKPPKKVHTFSHRRFGDWSIIQLFVFFFAMTRLNKKTQIKLYFFLFFL